MAACSGGGGEGASYIGHSVQHEPLDQTDLKDDIDWISMAVENRPTKESLTCGAHKPVGLGVGLAGPPINASAQSLVGCLLYGSRVLQCWFQHG